MQCFWLKRFFPDETKHFFPGDVLEEVLPVDEWIPDPNPYWQHAIKHDVIGSYNQYAIWMMPLYYENNFIYKEDPDDIFPPDSYMTPGAREGLTWGVLTETLFPHMMTPAGSVEGIEGLN